MTDHIPSNHQLLRALREIAKCLELAAAGQSIQLAAARGKVADVIDWQSGERPGCGCSECRSQRAAPETDAGTAAGLTMAQAISEAEDLLECAQPADNLEAATDDDWYEQRRQWMLRNTFRPHELKANQPPKAAVTEAETCPTGDWPHRAHILGRSRQCIYCGSPMPLPTPSNGSEQS